VIAASAATTKTYVWLLAMALLTLSSLPDSVDSCCAACTTPVRLLLSVVTPEETVLSVLWMLPSCVFRLDGMLVWTVLMFLPTEFTEVWTLLTFLPREFREF